MFLKLILLLQSKLLHDQSVCFNSHVSQRSSSDWGFLNLFVIANITGSKHFISHAAYQSYLTDIWMGNIHASTPTWKVRFLCRLVCSFRLCIFVALLVMEILKSDKSLLSSKLSCLN